MLHEPSIIINEELWEQADWIGTAFASSEDEIPAIALVFEKETPAIEIFQQWQADFGKVDEEEKLRISIIEGEIADQPEGYTIHISPNLDKILTQADETQIDITNKYQRLTESENSTGLVDFKAAFSKFKQYHILPAFYVAESIQPIFDVAILKTAISFRNAPDISENDVDAVIFK
ncbi:hypothetical protein QUF74_11600 [Candidatus Halobeggiatoa sp. HSG11]|nr:hypothetical protein [Candidatus Halobeggiatoa sp. HSG11]